VGPRVFLLDPGVIAMRRAEILTGDEKFAATVRRLRHEADQALKQQPLSVMEKPQIPPSGDKHDYMSLAPYWWPDSSKSDGLPYIRRDGEVNPERATFPDRKNLGKMISSVYALARAYYFTENEPYAEHAAAMLRVWFLNPSTRMNPNLNFGQAVKGHNQGRGAGLIETSGLRFIVDAIGLLQHSRAWTDGDMQAMKTWFDRYFEWLTTSHIGCDEALAKNNHGTWYDVQAVSIAFFLDKSDAALTILKAAGLKRIATQIEPDGRMPLELVRTKALGYTTMNTNAFLSLSMLGERVGVHLLSFTTVDGRNIRRAVNWVTPFWTGEREWTYPQIIPFDHADCAPLLVQAGLYFRDRSYLRAAESIPGMTDLIEETLFMYGDMQ
jgi:hypothetical protein